MTSTDWGPVDPTTDHGITASDLFGGEHFGDELMAMYNSAADVGHEMTDNEIPSHIYLEIHQDSNHPEAFEAMIAAGMDDGLGAFRPSTSFSDLTSLPHTETTPEISSDIAVIPLATTTPAPVASEAAKTTAERKRPATARDGLAAKKRACASKARPGPSAAGRRVAAKTGKTTDARTATTKAGPQSAGQTVLKLRKEQRALTNARAAKGTNETPNPLSVGSGPRAAWLPKAPVNIAKPDPVNASASLPAVVSPKTTCDGNGISIRSDAAAAAAAAVVAAAGPAPTKVGSAGVTTEADFKSVAQAAVTSLILNAGSQKPEAGSKGRADADAFTGKIDTSTEHIKALTSSNWVNACGGGTDDNSADGASGLDSKANNRARRQNLTPDERARQNRDRNREHARNTRLRKKAYVEELKRTLTELVSQRDAAELDKRHAAQREMEQREVRFRVMEEFLKLRGRSETSLTRWVAILEDNFILTLPETDYRRTVHGRNDATGKQLLRGAAEVMTDATYVASLLSALTQESSAKESISLLHHCERKNFFMDGSIAVLDWTASVGGAYSQEFAANLSFKGIMRAKFSPASNKLISVELIFDPGSVASQLEAAKAHTLVTADNCDEVAAAAAAQAAANEADALLDSLQMPHLHAVTAATTVMPQSAAVKDLLSVTCSEKEDGSSDEDTMERDGDAVMARRSTRLKI